MIYVNEVQFDLLKEKGIYLIDVNDVEYLIIDSVFIQKQKGYFTAEKIQEMLSNGISESHTN